MMQHILIVQQMLRSQTMVRFMLAMDTAECEIFFNGKYLFEWEKKK
jgi:hypothetical protein